MNVNLKIGIGTTQPTNAGLVIMTGNVGIGTWVPGTLLDVNGTTRIFNQTPVSGASSLIVRAGAGQSSSYLLDVQNNAGSSIMNFGNSLGINLLSVPAIVLSNANVNIGFGINGIGMGANKVLAFGSNNNPGGGAPDDTGLSRGSVGKIYIGNGTQGDYSGTLIATNIGIGSVTPSQALDVTGTIRTTNFTMTGQTPLSGYVLTSMDSTGATTWTAPGNINTGNWTVTNTTDVYQTKAGNVGIGTTITNNAALTVMNGNVGIGTWVPKGSLDVGATGTICLGGTCNSTWPAGGGSSYWNYSPAGNIGVSTIQAVGIGTSFIGGTGEAALSVMNGNVGIGTWVPYAPLTIKGTIAPSIDNTYDLGGNGGAQRWVSTF